MNVQLKKTLFVFGVAGFTLGILWSVSTQSENVRAVEPVEVGDNDVNEDEQLQIVSPDEPFWFQLMPKSSVTKRDEQRIVRQQELAEMITSLQGVRHAVVVLSDNETTGIGMPIRPMAACVSVDPTQPLVPSATVSAIQKLVASATTGLSSQSVLVINARTGMECSDEVPALSAVIHTEVLQENIERALGLRLADVTVSMETDADELVVPFRTTAHPVVRITLPSSWVAKRSSHVGNKAVLLESLRAIISRVNPNARVDFQFVQDSRPHSSTQIPNESYAKNIAVALGLSAIMSSGFFATRRKGEEQGAHVQYVVSPVDEAIRILELGHEDAKKVIDTLHGPFKTRVLQAIIDSDDEREIPVIEVQRQLELSKCV